METSMKLMRCGNCGCNLVEVYTDRKFKVILECSECKATTKLQVPKPKIRFEFGDDSPGCHTIFSSGR